MKWLGLSKSKVLKTPEDVMEHSYGVKSEEVSVDVSFEDDSDDTSEDDSLSYTSGADSDLEPEDYTQYLVDSFKKDDLVAIATKLGLETDGNKADIAARITELEFASK